MALKDKKTKLFESRREETQKTDESVLREEIDKLEKKLTEKKKVIVEKEAPKEVKEKLEEIRQIESEKKEEIKQEQPSKKTPLSPQISDDVKNDVKKIKNLDQENQVKTLIKLTFEKNLAYAIKVARNLDNPYVLDEFHDILVDEYYEEMVRKGKLKKT